MSKRITQGEITRRVRAKLEASDIPTEIVNNNTVEAGGRFITTVVAIKKSMRGESGFVSVFIDGKMKCGFPFQLVEPGGEDG